MRRSWRLGLGVDDGVWQKAWLFCFLLYSIMLGWRFVDLSRGREHVCFSAAFGVAFFLCFALVRLDGWVLSRDEETHLMVLGYAGRPMCAL